MRVAIFLAILTLCGCGRGPEPTPTTRFDTLESGVVVATSGIQGAWEAGAAGAIAPRLLLQIGGANAVEDAHLFAAIQGVLMDDLQRIFVLEAQAKEVRVFDLQGNHLRTMGREGQGPGEFLRPSGMARSPQGEIWIADPGNGRFQVFDTAGTALRTVPRVAGGMAARWEGGFDEEGYLREPSRTTEGLHLLRIDPVTGEALDSLPLPPDETDRFILMRREGGQVTGVGIYGIPFAPQRMWRVTDRTIWTGNGEAYELTGLSLFSTLDTTRVVHRDLPRIPVQQAEIDGYWETVGLAPADVRDLDLSKIPPEKRAFEDFFVDGQGTFWVARWADGVYGSRQAAPRPYDLFSPQGRFMGTLTLPVKPQPIPWADATFLVGVHADELDVPKIMVFRLDDGL